MDRDGSERSRSIPPHKVSRFFFLMADLGSLLLMSIDDDLENTDIVEDDDDIVLFTAPSCFMRRNLTRITGYFEQTIP